MKSSDSGKKKNADNAPDQETATPSNFIRGIIDGDLAAGKNDGKVATRFPPEPNGYLHIGHAKSICLNFGIATDYKGTCNLRFDDTNPSTEEDEYVRSIVEDVKWLGFDWEDRLCFASDYFEKFYAFAVELTKNGKAYVDSSTLDEIRKLRGDFTTPGKNSPYRDRTPDENLDLLTRMRAGEFEDGAHVLRAKIDMQSPNMNLRDPIIYRIRRATHHRTGDDWCIYPMYDFAHGLEDAIEGITHSICTLEFENHRPLYDWFLDNVSAPCHPQQIEFARLNLSYTVMSKRKLLMLVKKGLVSGWDDPRMPTISGMRRRGYSPKSLRTFCDRIGVARRDNTVDMALLEHTVREDLNETTPRVMAVLDPLKVVIENFPEGHTEEFDAPLHPEDPSHGSRKLPLTKVIYVEKDDFREDPPKKWHRLGPGREVRLRYACLIKCHDFVKDESGEVTELRCTWDPESKGGTSPDGRKVRGTLHFVSAEHALDAEVRLYDRLFTKENPLDTKDGTEFTEHINPDSLAVIKGCKLEPHIKDTAPGTRVQFERLGYFCADAKDSSEGALVFNRTITLRDTWAKIEKATKKNQAQKKPKKAKAEKSDDGGKHITIDQFAKLDLRVGVVKESSLVEGADKLLRLMVDVGKDEPIQVFSGIRSHYPEPEKLVGQKVMVLVNLKPRKMRFGVSEGMVLTGGSNDRLGLVTFEGDPQPGDTVS